MKGLVKFLFAVTVGAVYGLLFAQKPGKKLRSELKKSDNPWMTLLEEGKSVDKEARGVVMDWAENSKELQEILSTGKAQFDNFIESAKDLSTEGKEMAQIKLEELAANAKKAADSLKDEATKKINTIRNDAVKTVKNIGKK